MIDLIRREFKGNVAVSISDDEVRVWCCNNKGENVFRFKALGVVHSLDNSENRTDLLVVGGEKPK